MVWIILRQASTLCEQHKTNHDGHGHYFKCRCPYSTHSFELLPINTSINIRIWKHWGDRLWIECRGGQLIILDHQHSTNHQLEPSDSHQIVWLMVDINTMTNSIPINRKNKYPNGSDLNDEEWGQYRARIWRHSNNSRSYDEIWSNYCWIHKSIIGYII